jgi:uncharacterized protein (TIGR03435 family)
MTERVEPRLDFRRKLLLSVVGLVAVSMPIAVGLVNATHSRAESQALNTAATAAVFEVASIKPDKSGSILENLEFRRDGFSAMGVTLQLLIRSAYGVEADQIAEAPGWLKSEKYSIEAKIDNSVAGALRKLGPDQRMLEHRRMLQALLADRFKLKLHSENKQLHVYALVVSKNGPKLRVSNPDDTYPNGLKGPDGRTAMHGLAFQGRGQLTGQSVPIALLARELSGQLGRTVKDETNLVANYDFTLHWTPDESQALAGDQQRTDNSSSPESTGPSIFTAIQEQLGLKLESKKGSVEILVIDYVERPSEN